MPLPIPRSAYKTVLRLPRHILALQAFVHAGIDVLLFWKDTMSVHQVSFDAKLKTVGSVVKCSFGDFSFEPRRCAHDIDLNWRVTVSMSQSDQ